MKLETMSDFFAYRVNGYDEHMINNVGGCRKGYIKMASLVPDDAVTLLDLGCGTGLELDEIFKRLPHISVTGIDMTKEMLNVLTEKHKDKDIRLICDDYFKIGLGNKHFDVAVSFQTMHHFTHAQKLELYARLRDSLKDGGVYIECDYMVLTQAEEDFYFSEFARIKREMGVPESEHYHYDTPCTIENQVKLLSDAGFTKVDIVFREESTTMLLAKK